jgi:hypothetical protein
MEARSGKKQKKKSPGKVPCKIQLFLWFKYVVALYMT